MKGTLGSLDSLKDVPLHLALDNTGVGLVACDAAGRLTLMSPVLQEIFETVYEPISEPFVVERFDLYRSDGETRLAVEEVPLHRARRGEFVRDEVVTSRRPDGTLVHLRCNASPLRDAQGEDVGAVALVQDVTAEVEAARRTETVRQRLVETINHEFRTPLTGLLAHVELIREHRERLAETDPELARWLEAVERSGWRLRDLVCEAAGLVNEDPDAVPVDRRPRRFRAS